MGVPEAPGMLAGPMEELDPEEPGCETVQAPRSRINERIEPVAMTLTMVESPKLDYTTTLHPGPPG